MEQDLSIHKLRLQVVMLQDLEIQADHMDWITLDTLLLDKLHHLINLELDPSLVQLLDQVPHIKVD
jgi:hypothetical protein